MLRNSNFVKMVSEITQILLNKKSEFYAGVGFYGQEECPSNGWNSYLCVNEWFKDNNIFIKMGGLNAWNERDDDIFIKFDTDSEKITIKRGGTAKSERLNAEQLGMRFKQLVETIR